MHTYFESKAALLVRDEIRLLQSFYRGLIALVKRHGREEEALTIFDLEAMLVALPGVTADFAVAVCKLASNNGKEYVSAHELQRRLEESIICIFKQTYIAFLITTGKISMEEFAKLELAKAEKKAEEKYLL